MDKCRESFEKDWQERHKGFGVPIHDEELEYYNLITQEEWEVWQRAWNASHNRCMEICREIPWDSEYERDEYVACTECINLIKKDKAND